MIYLDNSATTSKKPSSVVKSFNKAIKKYSFNPGRGGHEGSIKTGIKVSETREAIADFFNSENPEGVIFTTNCTSALNIAILGTIKKEGHIVTTYQEHNSVLRTLSFAKKQYGVSFSIAYPERKFLSQLTTKDILKKVKTNTYLIIINQTSNVTGNTIELEEIGKFCHKNKILFLVESAQSAGHENIDMCKQHINLLAVAGHKGLYGPQGIGALVTRKTKLNPIFFGGTGTNSNSTTQPNSLPDGFESGTLPTPNIIALKSGIDFVSKNFESINYKMEKLTTKLINGLNSMENIILYSHNKKSGVVSFNVNGIDSTDVGNILNEKFNIYVRCGLHCAPLVHRKFNTISRGMVRVSLSYFNSAKEMRKFLKAIRWVVKNYPQKL